MTYKEKIGWALMHARERRGFDLDQVEERISRRFPKYKAGSLVRWERGEDLAPSDMLLELLYLYKADIYEFMSYCLIEEMQRVDH